MSSPLEATSEEKIAVFTTDNDSKFVDKKYANLKSDVLEITHDKLENILLKFYQNHLLRTAWFNPLSLGVGVALTLCTTEFKTAALGVEGATWKAVFLILLVVSIGWLAVVVIKLAVKWRETSIQFLINKIKNVSS